MQRILPRGGGVPSRGGSSRRDSCREPRAHGVDSVCPVYSVAQGDNSVNDFRAKRRAFFSRRGLAPDGGRLFPGQWSLGLRGPLSRGQRFCLWMRRGNRGCDAEKKDTLTSRQASPIGVCTVAREGARWVWEATTAQVSGGVIDGREVRAAAAVDVLRRVGGDMPVEVGGWLGCGSPQSV